MLNISTPPAAAVLRFQLQVSNGNPIRAPSWMECHNAKPELSASYLPGRLVEQCEAPMLCCRQAIIIHGSTLCRLRQRSWLQGSGMDGYPGVPTKRKRHRKDLHPLARPCGWAASAGDWSKSSLWHSRVLGATAERHDWELALSLPLPHGGVGVAWICTWVWGVRSGLDHHPTTTSWGSGQSDMGTHGVQNPMHAPSAAEQQKSRCHQPRTCSPAQHNTWNFECALSRRGCRRCCLLVRGACRKTMCRCAMQRMQRLLLVNKPRWAKLSACRAAQAF